MTRAILQGAAWLAFYLAIIIVPIVMFVGILAPAPRNYWTEFGVFVGFALLLLLTLQFLLTARFQGIGAPFGTDSVLQLHRQIGILLLLFLVGHPLILILAKPKNLEYFDPRENFLRATFLMLASIAMVMLIALSLWRTKFKLNYEWWRLTHGVLASGIVLVGVAHSWQVGHYVDGWGKRIFLVVIGLTAIGSWLYVRLARPWMARQKPYQIVGIRDEKGESSTVVLEPIGHSGMSFRSGQYAWITLGDSPFRLQQNPYTFSSSDQEAPNRLEFTAKELGDFSEQFANAQIGTCAYLEGPYGLFCLDDDAPGAVFIMGGIGVTPAISMLKKLRDRNDTRPLVLIYGNSNFEETTFRPDLLKLEKELRLRVVHVLAEPTENWRGESGYIDRKLLERTLSSQERTYPMFVCGPEPMMDSVEDALLELKIAMHQIRVERFDIV